MYVDHLMSGQKKSKSNVSCALSTASTTCGFSDTWLCLSCSGEGAPPCCLTSAVWAASSATCASHQCWLYFSLSASLRRTKDILHSVCDVFLWKAKVRCEGWSHILERCCSTGRLFVCVALHFVQMYHRDWHVIARGPATIGRHWWSLGGCKTLRSRTPPPMVVKLIFKI